MKEADKILDIVDRNLNFESERLSEHCSMQLELFGTCGSNFVAPLLMAMITSPVSLVLVIDGARKRSNSTVNCQTHIHSDECSLAPVQCWG